MIKTIKNYYDSDHGDNPSMAGGDGAHPGWAPGECDGDGDGYGDGDGDGERDIGAYQAHY